MQSLRRMKELSKPDKERQIWYHLHVKSLKTKRYKSTYLENRTSLADIENKLTATKGRRDKLGDWD